LTRPSLRGSTGIFSKKIFFSELFILGLFEVLIELYYRLSGVRRPNLKSDFQSDLPIG
jgi:hypothetical protein